MKAKDLLSKLRALNPEYDVLCYCEDKSPSAAKNTFKVFEIDGVDLTEAEKARGEDGIPFLKLGKTKYSESLVLINITSDF